MGIETGTGNVNGGHLLNRPEHVDRVR